MSDILQFPANSVLDWYIEAESMLADFLKYVPYCKSHEEVWSPKLVVVLQETCSQLDSLWRWEAVNVHGRKDDKINITDYFEIYGAQMALRWVVFWADKPVIVAPFGVWWTAGDLSIQKYPKGTPEWWAEGYQKVKHSRIENRTCATLKRTVKAIAGLFLAIVGCESCWECLWERHWLSSCYTKSIGSPLASLRAAFKPTEHKGDCPVLPMGVESKLFAYRISRCDELVRELKGCPYSANGCSRRFQAW